MNQFFLQANYRVLPSFEEIRSWENKYNKTSSGELIFSVTSHHEIFDSEGIIIFRNGKWEDALSEELFEDLLERGEDYPVAYVESTGVLGLGKWMKTEKSSTLDWSRWLDEEAGYVDWREIILAATKEFGDLSCEQYLSCLLRLEWSPSIDWESGIDEGGFEIVEEIFNIK